MPNTDSLLCTITLLQYNLCHRPNALDLRDDVGILPLTVLIVKL